MNLTDVPPREHLPGQRSGGDQRWPGPELVVIRGPGPTKGVALPSTVISPRSEVTPTPKSCSGMAQSRAGMPESAETASGTSCATADR